MACRRIVGVRNYSCLIVKAWVLMRLTVASRRIIGVCNYSCLIVKRLVTNEVDSGIQTYRRSV